MADLVSPKIGYKTLRDDFITLLEANLVSLNTGLTTGSTFADGTNIKGGNPFVTVITDFPTILVAVARKSENFSAITKDKNALISLIIYPMTQQFTTEQSDEDELMTLVDNIEGLCRISDDNIQFSSKVQYSQPTDVDFFFINDGTNTYVAVASIELECIMRIE